MAHREYHWQVYSSQKLINQGQSFFLYRQRMRECYALFGLTDVPPQYLEEGVPLPTAPPTAPTAGPPEYHPVESAIEYDVKAPSAIPSLLGELPQGSEKQSGLLASSLE